MVPDGRDPVNPVQPAGAGCVLLRECPAVLGAGAVAQLVAHHTGSVGVRGSSPLSSTVSVVIERASHPRKCR